ncbi:bublin coiled-coil protein [Garra rufa]|uniref:bublin coiled-coil protein n=1 Tax=Garra rufa TaxID=137080 RepID=UPI003CCE8A1E
MSGPNGEPNVSVDDGIIEDEDEFNDEEYAAIDSMLDQINSCLDDIEERNEALNGKLHELLESNRQARRDFREQLNDEEHPPPPPAQESDSTDTH